MIHLYFRDIRRRVRLLEDRYLPKPSREFTISWVDEDGTVTMIAGPGFLWERDEDETEDPSGGLTEPTDSNPSDYSSGDAI